jgi:general nucleoside transport system ATP-binding protein
VKVDRRGADGAPPASAVEAVGIVKHFPGVIANDGVHFEAAAGEVHALLGENGAGKSTLSNILTGLYRPDLGEIRLYGRPVEFDTPRDALDAGICMVHQHFRLVEPFTVAENVVLGDHRGAGKAFRLRPRAIERRVAELSKRYGLHVDPRARIWQLSLGEQQRVEILKALYREARILILDEPTAVLTPQEADVLFETLRDMADEGRTVIFISHKLHEVKAVSDRVTVLRNGRTIATVATADATPRTLAALMVGRELASEHVAVESRAPGEGVLRLDGVWAEGDRGAPAVRGATLEVRAGEIVAIAGVAGNGQRELAETIAGIRTPTEGTLTVGGRGVRGDPRTAMRAGVAYVPEDRLGTGVAPSLSIERNLVLRSYRRPPASKGFLLSLRGIRERAIELIRAYQIATPGPASAARLLSGGNLQKVVLAREFSGKPKLLVAASPTRGLDVGAIETVHDYLRGAAADGVAILLISEDLDEILALADRIAVMYEGAIVGETTRAEASVDEIGLMMAGGHGPAAD